MSKTPYTEPVLTDHGTLADLTAATTMGSQLDRDIPAGTPVNELPGVIANSLS